MCVLVKKQIIILINYFDKVHDGFYFVQKYEFGRPPRRRQNALASRYKLQNYKMCSYQNI